jgi:glycosyltransferase involved in cell wall biosynthesis
MKIAIVMPSHGLSGGSRKHLERIVPLLEGDARVAEVRLFVSTDLVAEFRDRARACSPISRHPAEGYLGYPTLRREIARMAPTVVFVPTARLVPSGGAPVVVMVRNMEPILRPREGNSLTDTLRNVARAKAALHACRRAAHVIAVSDHVRDVLVERWRIPIDKISVVPHGVEAEEPARAEAPSVLGQRALGRFAFTAGSVRPARGLEDLIPAFAAARRNGALDTLVIAGETSGAAAEYRRAITELVRAHGIEPEVVWTGNLSAADMAWCFRNASAFVMTSRAEACPNIVLEALAYGALSISTTQAPMPEFYGEAARYYRAGDADDMTRQLLALEKEASSALTAARRAARARAKDFTWALCARRTVEALAMGGGR